jgi:uncharacterized repeat protein (TIGR01451 family)
VIHNTACPVDTGSVTLSPTGGVSPYSYQWGTGSTATGITGLGGGSYDVTVSDNAGCSVSAVETVISTSSLSVATTQSGLSCSPLLNAIASGGAGSISYSWSNGANTDTTTVNQNAIYLVTVTDANSCSASASVQVNSVYPLTLDSFGVVEPGCAGATGSITASVLSGIGPFNYLWSPAEPDDSILTNLAVGSYSLTVVDVNNCIGLNNYYLYQVSASAYISSYTNPSCGGADGALTVYAYNGSGTYNYLWSTGATTATVSALPVGTYTVTVTDVVGGGCTAIASYTLQSTAAYQVAITATPTACDTALHTGTATAVITGTGGTAPYSFVWIASTYINYAGTDTLGYTQTISNLTYGSYISVAVTDANGCSPQSVANDSSYIALDPSCFDHITGYVYLDANTNCIRDAGEQGVTGGSISAAGTGGYFYGNPDSTGYYDIAVVAGTYQVSVNLYNYGVCVTALCVGSYADTFTTTGQVSSGNDFAVDGGSTFDLGVHPGCTPGTVGGTKQYWVYYYNQGVAAATGATLTFTHDSTLTLLSTSPAYTNYNAATQTITWSLGTVPVSTSWTEMTMLFSVPVTEPLGITLYAQAEIDPISGDCNPGNNIVNISDVVTGSHDPNFKEVSPAGNLTAADSILTYTIQFQNDGNAPANTIVIKDTLSPNVNPATVIPGASSFPGYKFTMSGNGIMTFTFQGINLPDTSHGSASQGFVSYTVHTMPGLPLGTVVNNTGYVYFDYNAAVVTNTTTNERSDYPNGISTIGGAMTVNVTPNPAHDQAVIQFTGTTGTISLQIRDALGQTVATSRIENKTYTLDAQSLSPGVYFYTATDAAGHKATGKVSVVH